MAMTDLEVAVQLLGGNTNKVIYDDVGMPSIMVRFDKGTIADVITGGTENTHPAFLVDGAEKAAFWYSKYQNIRIKCADGLYRAYSLPLQDPTTGINFDTARGYCENKGNGWHIATNAEWAWIALQCKMNGFMPRGSNNYGKDYSRPDEKGIVTYTYIDKETLYNGRVATGSGPKSWAHNNDASGVWDLNGNVVEWIGGYRTVDQEIQIIPYNNAANKLNPQTVGSTLWKAIMPDGSLVDPGTAGTLKWDFSNANPTDYSAFRLNTSVVNTSDVANYGSLRFKSLVTADGVTAPEILKALALFPADNGNHGDDYIYMGKKGERFASRGGRWGSRSDGGVFCLLGFSARPNTVHSIGFRSAFVEL